MYILFLIILATLGIHLPSKAELSCQYESEAKSDNRSRKESQITDLVSHMFVTDTIVDEDFMNNVMFYYLGLGLMEETLIKKGFEKSLNLVEVYNQRIDTFFVYINHQDTLEYVIYGERSFLQKAHIVSDTISIGEIKVGESFNILVEKFGLESIPDELIIYPEAYTSRFTVYVDKNTSTISRICFESLYSG
ncbi:hypothetical protein [Tunicatimonas pelagia]|uniref:hypothetical protein n=1 Tax=Tunicatimonas pelagia TaxID=931531 RepID=UPI00266551E1|nr:hypothetical protein [Tunicatimonas pelagia]WKN44228.1 hypothetical protein P0M28_04515 [Tunicatimonas pelagia]